MVPNILSRTIAVGAVLLNFTLLAQNKYKQQEAIAVRINQPIELNGKLDDPVWSSAIPFLLQHEVLPGDNLPAQQKTIVRVLYDDENIYFGFECFDSNPSMIRANITDRDKIFNDDYVEIILDTYCDYQKGYSFAVNPFGVKGDKLIYQDEEDENADWIWHSAASINERGWTAEFAIPFSSLSYSQKEIQTWGLHIFRYLPRSSMTKLSWIPMDRNDPGYLSQAGLLTGLTNLKSTGGVEILPYAMGQQSGARTNLSNPSSNFVYDKFESRFGAGIKYAPSTDFTLDAVINPDFSQVESDADQISVNTTFALLYDEKRPFFLVGRELLSSPMYYSRSINDPLVAARVHGKSGSLSYLAMSAYDRNTVVVLSGQERSTTVASNLKSLANIGRVRYEFGNESYLGGMIYTRNISDAHNYVIGMDWNYKFWGNWYFGGEAFLSNTKELNDPAVCNSARQFGDTGHDAAFNGENYWGYSLIAWVVNTTRSYKWSISAVDISPTHLSYNGILTVNGYRALYAKIDHIFYPQNSFIDKGTIGFNSSIRFNYEGPKRIQFFIPQMTLILKGQTTINASYFLVYDELFNGIMFKGQNQLLFGIVSRPISEISLTAEGTVGKFIYRTVSPIMGEGHKLSANLTLKPNEKLDITFSYSRARLSNVDSSDLLYDGNIYRLVGIYQFSQELFFRTIIQYNTFDNTFQLYPLVSYKLNAFTTFFAGVTSTFQDYKEDVGIINTGQQYFIKLQYLLGI
ncbi:MAG: hypothetical protein A2V66_15900 [Ignavibacteria bacterium RBG_13_36_8]|nr:MAG: hypothetical protein A2V66_15900 [Ignavibacteria bacterium RBG_13_36_8]